MARGDRRGEELNKAERARINLIISRAEEDTGLEFCLLYGSKPQTTSRDEAERAFAKLGLRERPGVMIQAVPHSRTIEVVTSEEAQVRVSDKDCDEAVRLMSGMFALGEIVEGLEHGIQFLADQAGGDKQGDGRHRADLPNVVDLDDPLPPES